MKTSSMIAFGAIALAAAIFVNTSFADDDKNANASAIFDRDCKGTPAKVDGSEAHIARGMAATTLPSPSRPTPTGAAAKAATWSFAATPATLPASASIRAPSGFAVTTTSKTRSRSPCPAGRSVASPSPVSVTL